MRVSRRAIALALLAVFCGNLVVMGAGAAYSYANAPPIPDELGDGTVTADQVREGKVVFQREGLMNHGSVFGNGAYFGVDLTADALDRKRDAMRAVYANGSYAALPPGEQARVDALVREDLRERGYSRAESIAHDRVREQYVDRFHEGNRSVGLPQGTVRSAEDARRLADFALWTAWLAHTDRPGTDHSYTNEWPYTPGVTGPTAGTLTWSVLSVALLVLAAGAGVWLYRAIDLPEPPAVDEVEMPAPGEVTLTPTQRVAAWFVGVASLLFLVQTLLGGLLAHYYLERAGFFGLFSSVGIDILDWLPFHLARTWHIDLAVLWVTTIWLGAGLFLPGLLTDYEPPNQARYVKGLLAALLVVVVGGLAGVWLGAQGYIDHWWLLGNEGLEYLEVGRVWQTGLLLGFAGWAWLVARGFRPLLREEDRFGLAHLTLYAGGSIGLLFLAGMAYTPRTSMVMTEFWRWWVVHMWVEGAFEFFVVAVIALALVSMNLLERGHAAKAVAFEALFVMGTAVVGVAHHYWWVGQPDVWLPLGTVFSTLEFIPLVFILFEATTEYRTLASGSFPYRLPFAFIVASGLWNFVGAGALGFFINLPLVNYYEHGTYLTVAHAHAAMFGAFGLLALGLGVYMLQVRAPGVFRERTVRRAFWAWNVGLALMVFGSVLPVGILQLEVAYTAGYDAARSLAFYERPLVQTLFWARAPGDLLLIVGAGLFAKEAVRCLTPRSRDGTSSP